MQITPVVIVDIDQAKNYLNIELKSSIIIALTPDAFFFLKNNKIKNLKSPFNLQSKKLHKSLVMQNMFLKKKIIRLFNTEKKFSSFEKENLKNILLQINSTINYIWLTLPNTKFIYVFKKNKILKLKPLEAHSEILNYIFLKKMGIFKLSVPNSVYSFYYIKLFLNKIIFFCNKKKSFFFINEYNIFFKNIIQKILIKKKNSIFLYFEPIFNNKFHSLFFLIKNFIKLIFKIDNKIIVLSPHLRKSDLKTKEIIRLLKKLNLKLIDGNLILLSNFFSNIFSYLNSINFFLYENINKEKIDSVITNYLTWGNISVVGNFFKKNKKKVILASHGITLDNQNYHASLELENLNAGLVSSPFATNILAQSPSSYNCAKKNNLNKCKIIKSYPLMYNGYRLNKKVKSKSKTIKILYANTYKVFASRPWIYETSFEFLENLKIVADVEKKLSNVELLIKIRPNDELSLQTIINYIKPNKRIKIFTQGSIDSFMNKSELLITGFSTTIDEFLHLNKPVIVFGNKMRFQPYGKYSKRENNNIKENLLKPIYYSNKKNIEINLKSIIYLIKTNKSKLKEVDKYIWSNNKNTLSNSFSKIV
jgi:hypothetical protein